jgi:hypothetical protein
VLPLGQPQFQVRAVRIITFFGTSENVVTSRLWTAVSVYVLVAIVKKGLTLSTARYEMLQILSLTLCERMSWVQRLTQAVLEDINYTLDKPLVLFE